MQKLAEQKLSKTGPSPLLNYFKVILNIGCCLCLVPFRLVESKSRFKIITHKAHQIICGIVHFVILYRYVVALRFVDHSSEESKNHYMSLTGLVHFGYFIDIVYGIGFIYTVWVKKSKIHKMIMLIETLDIVENRGRFTELKIKALALTLCCLLAIFAITDTRLHGSSLTNGNIWKYFLEIYDDAQRIYLFRDPLIPPEGFILKFFAGFFSFIHLLTGLPHFFLAHVFELFLVLTAICMRHLMKDFNKFCKNCGNVNEVLSQYEILKELVKTVNGVIRVLILCCVGVSLPFYTFWAALAYFEEHIVIHFFIHFGTFFILLTVAAEFNAKATKFYIWIASLEHIEVITPNRLVSLNMDMNSNQLAIRGSGFFTMTYRFFGTILSVLVTYTVIIIQFQVTRQGFGLAAEVASGLIVDGETNISVHNHVH